MKRNLLLTLCSIAALQYSMISATVGDIIGSAVNTAEDVAASVVGPVERTERVEVVAPAVVVAGEPVAEPVVVTETVPVSVEKTIIIPDVDEPVVLHSVAPASAETVVYTEEVPHHHRGWFRNFWYNLTGW